ncbi:hypothetical protein G6F42_024152 [Rhizopus arrhizus]|nr:hypothetical protein G6F42_024152 [Rhizopus arrhizus]
MEQLWHCNAEYQYNKQKKRPYYQAANGTSSHEITQKMYSSFFPSTLAPSISANKPRVRSTETQALKSVVFIIKINGTVDTMPSEEITASAFKKFPHAFSYAFKDLT